MDKDVFRFKKFSVKHCKSSMKVGVDAVLLGSWAGENAKNILDVGTGCGVIALALAQRFPDAKILGIDIDSDSIEEANENFTVSPWHHNLKVRSAKFPDEMAGCDSPYDLIVSNPPYFNSGIDHPVTPREKARHRDSLSVETLLKNAKNILTADGRISVIFPSYDYDDIIKVSQTEGWNVVRECWIRNNVNLPYKRIMMEFIKSDNEKISTVGSEYLTLFEDGCPTAGYLQLCSPYYLKF